MPNYKKLIQRKINKINRLKYNEITKSSIYFKNSMFLRNSKTIFIPKGKEHDIFLNNNFH